MKSLTNTSANTQASVSAMPATAKARPVFREYPKYDEKYCREYEATIAGVFFFLVPILFTFFCVLSFVKYEGYDTFLTILSVGAVVLRTISTIWVAKLSKELNRNSIQWMAFAFLLPGTALTIIGQKKKLFQPADWRKYLYSNNKTVTMSYTKTQTSHSFQLAS